MNLCMMDMDFTHKKYSQLLNVFIDNGYRFITFENYCNRERGNDDKFVILRHDVDLKAENSLEIAKIEHHFGIKASYYFRVVEQSNKPEIIKAIASMGHEIGYHYEDMTVCEGQAEKAIAHFEKCLSYFRQYYPVETICMHGSPRSKFDGRDLWKDYDYHDYGIIGLHGYRTCEVAIVVPHCPHRQCCTHSVGNRQPRSVRQCTIADANLVLCVLITTLCINTHCSHQGDCDHHHKLFHTSIHF